MEKYIKKTGISQILDDPVSRCPDREAIVFDDWRITYRELGDLGNKCAHYMLQHGAKKGDKIAVISRNCPEFLIIDLAILKIGAISVKFNWRLGPEDMKYLLDLNEVSIAFMKPERDDWGRELVEHYRGRIHFELFEYKNSRSSLCERLADQPSDPLSVEVADQDVAFHMHTSGTTGRPKCVEYASGNYLANKNTSSGSLAQLIHKKLPCTHLSVSADHTYASSSKKITDFRYCFSKERIYDNLSSFTFCLIKKFQKSHAL